MNRNEWEQRMKYLLEEQPFPPEEQGWQQLSAALQPPVAASGTAPRRVWFTPLRIAAAAVGLLLAGTAVFMAVRNEKPQAPDTMALQPAIAPPSKAGIVQPPFVTPAPGPHAAAVAATTPASRTAAGMHALPNAFVPPAGVEPVAVDAAVAPPVPVSATTAAEHPASNKGNMQEGPFPVWNGNTYAGAPSPSPSPALHLGVNAQVSSSTVSPVVYQVGIVGRRELSGKIYVEAGLSLASNTVSNASKHVFSTIEHNTATGLSSVSTSEVEADYSRNVVSLGFSPSLGLKATRKLSFSAGAAVNRNLNPSLAITNGRNIAADAFSKNIVSTTQAITSWDIGLTCNADYKITHNLSMSAGYRKGLSDYLLQNNNYLKNSGVHFGLKYLFGRRP